MDFIHPAMNAARLAVKNLPKQLPVKVPIIDTFFQVKKPVDDESSTSSLSSSNRKDSSSSTITNSKSAKKIYSIFADSPAEKSILNFYDENIDFQKSDSLFCLFNPGFSTLPEKFLERRCRRLLILDSSKKSCDYWRRFKSNYVDGGDDHAAEINVEQLDFTHLSNQTLCDLRKGQPNTFAQILRKYGCRPQIYADENAEAQANFIGVLPFFKERSFFYELLNTRLQNVNLFEFGRVDFLVYVSASKYMVLDAACPALFSRCRARRNMYSTFFDTKLIEKVKFNDETSTTTTPPGKSFTVDVNPEKGHYAQFLTKNQIDIDSAYLLHLKPKLDRSVPLISSPKQQHDQIQLYKHFEYFNRQLNLNTKNLADFLGNFFAGSEDFLVANGEEQNFLKLKSKSLNLDQEIRLFNSLRNWDGYENCAFAQEAGKFVESSVFAVND